MNTKRLVKVKAEDISEEISSTKSKKSIKLADESSAKETQNTKADELTTTNKKVIDQIGQLTRNLHDSLRELGYDKRLEAIAAEAPEAQDKLSYVATKTEQAADRTLNAIEIAMPIQDKLSTDAIHLSEQWKQAFEAYQTNPDAEKFKTLLIDTLQYLNKVPKQTNATNAQLMEIMMAQDFQDLTGQVIKKITHMVQSLERDLIDLLLANVPTKKNITVDEGLMNGPVINPEKRNDVVCNQDQVDDLLASLGF